MTSMVWTISVLAVPARGEGHGHPPSASARLFGKTWGVRTRARCATKRTLLHVGLASPTESLGDLCGIAVHGVPDEHAEALGKCRHLGTGLVSSDIIDGHASLGSEAEVDHLRHQLESTILGLEVYIRSPVV